MRLCKCNHVWCLHSFDSCLLCRVASSSSRCSKRYRNSSVNLMLSSLFSLMRFVILIFQTLLLLIIVPMYNYCYSIWFDFVYCITECARVMLMMQVESLAAARKLSMSGTEPSDAIRVVNALLTQLDQLKKSVVVLSQIDIDGLKKL